MFSECLSPVSLIRSTLICPLSFVRVPFVTALVPVWATARKVTFLPTIVALLPPAHAPGRCVTSLRERRLGRLSDGRLVEVKLAMLLFGIVITRPRSTCILLPLMGRLHPIVHPGRPLRVWALHGATIIGPLYTLLLLLLLLLRSLSHCIWVHAASPLLNL